MRRQNMYNLLIFSNFDSHYEILESSEVRQGLLLLGL